MKKKNLKILTVFAILFFALVLVTGCSGDAKNDDGQVKEGEVAKTKVLKVAHNLATDHPYHTGLVKFGELLKEGTEGRYDIEIFPSAQLGSEREAIEGVQMGTIDLTLVSTAPLSGFSDAFLISDLPFIFTSREHAYAVLDGEIGQSMFAELEGTGIKGLAFFENGFRNITNSKKPIVHPEDIKGMKIRTMENQIHMDSFRVLGADPTPMAFGELFTALQQKTVDAQENPIALIASSKFHEVQEHLSLTGHFYAPASLLMSEAVWAELSDEDKEIFQQSANDARDYQRETIKAMDEDILKQFEEYGIQIVEPDKAEWQKAMQPVYDQWEEKIGKDLIEQVKSLGK